MESINKSTADAFLKFEPFVLHVQCTSLQDAQLVHEVSVSSGFRNSGLTVGKRGKIMANVRSTHSLEVPVTRNGVQIVSDEYLAYTTELANSKLKENFERIARFRELLMRSLLDRAKEDEQEDGHAAKLSENGRRNERNKSVLAGDRETVELPIVAADARDTPLECLTDRCFLTDQT